MKLNFNDVRQVTLFYEGRNATYLELFKNYLLYVMDRQAILESEWTAWMANIKSPVTYVIVSAIYGMYLDNSVSFEVYRQIRRYKWAPVEKWVMDNLTEEQRKKIQDDIEEEDGLFSKAILDLLEHVYSVRWADEVLDEIALNAIITWTWYGGIEYIKFEDKYKYNDGNWGKKEYIEKEDAPNIYSINPLNFFPSWSKDGTRRRSKYDIVRKIMTKSTFDNVYKFFNITLNKKKIDDEWEIIELKDWDMVIKNMMFNNMPWVISSKKYDWWETVYWVSWWSHNDIVTDNSFQIGKNSDLYEIYEVHTDNTIQIFANGVDHWVFERVWPRKRRPFFDIKFKSWLNWSAGMWAWYIAYNYQKIIDMFLNLRIDTDKIAASQPVVVGTDETIFNWKDHIDFYPWKIIKMHDPKNGIQPLQTVQPWWTANNEVEIVSKMIQDSLGLSWYTLGVQQKIERAAKGITELVKWSERAMKEFVKNIARAMSFASKYITILSVEYMSDETMTNIIGDTKLKELNIEDLIKDYTVSFDLQPLKTGVDQATTEMIRRFIQDAANMTRADWTPLFDQEAGYRLLLEKSWLPNELLLTEEEAEKYMIKQLENKYKMSSKERDMQQKYWPANMAWPWEAQPSNWVWNSLWWGGTTMTWVPQSWETNPKWVPWWIPWMVGWEWGLNNPNPVRNPEWNNV